MKRFPFSLLLSLCFSLLACNPKDIPHETPLLPRATLMGGERFSGFKADPLGRFLFFQSTERTDQLFRIPLAANQSYEEVETGGRPLTWDCMAEGLLFATQLEGKFQLKYLSYAGTLQIIPLPEGCQRVRILALSKPEANQAALEIRTENPQLAGIYILEEKGAELSKKYDLQDKRVFFDENLDLAAAQGPNDEGGNTLYQFNAEKQAFEPFLETPFTMDVTMLGGFSGILSATQTSIYFTSNLDSDKSRLFWLDRKTGQKQELAADELVDILPFGQSMDMLGRVTSAVGLFAKSRREVVDPSWEADLKLLESKLKGDLSFAQSLKNDQLWLVREMAGKPFRFYTFDRQTKELTFIISDQPSLDTLQLADRHAFSAQTPDGFSLPFHLYLPPGSDTNGDGIPEKPLPTILYMHGGPWVGVVHWNQYFHWRNFQLLANRGYAVVNTEFRGSTGLGKDFVEAARKKWGTDMVADNAVVADWLEEHKVAIPDKIGLWGWSYGGYATMAGLSFYPEKYACGIAMYGPMDLVSFNKSAYVNGEFWHDWVGNPFDSTEAQMLAAQSPINFVDQVRAPVLLTTGSKDERVPQAQMDTMATALKNAGKEVQYFYYPEEVHDYRADSNWISFWEAGEKFLAKHLGGKYLPDSSGAKPAYVVVY
ncbi:MAG: S9 family peptidase [Bacteroidia bacterium]|nr:S9 family peptidase [Bacteroidia bacterium]